jgi:hypothetical protein
MPCRYPCRLYIHVAFTYSVGPSRTVGSELGPAPPLSPTRVLGVNWSRALSLVCKVALRDKFLGWGEMAGLASIPNRRQTHSSLCTMAQTYLRMKALILGEPKYRICKCWFYVIFLPRKPSKTSRVSNIKKMHVMVSLHHQWRFAIKDEIGGLGFSMST